MMFVSYYLFLSGCTFSDIKLRLKLCLVINQKSVIPCTLKRRFALFQIQCLMKTPKLLRKIGKTYRKWDFHEVNFSYLFISANVDNAQNMIAPNTDNTRNVHILPFLGLTQGFENISNVSFLFSNSRRYDNKWRNSDDRTRTIDGSAKTTMFAVFIFTTDGNTSLYDRGPPASGITLCHAYAYDIIVPFARTAFTANGQRARQHEPSPRPMTIVVFSVIHARCLTRHYYYDYFNIVHSDVTVTSAPELLPCRVRHKRFPREVRLGSEKKRTGKCTSYTFAYTSVCLTLHTRVIWPGDARAGRCSVFVSTSYNKMFIYSRPGSVGRYYNRVAMSRVCRARQLPDRRRCDAWDTNRNHKQTTNSWGARAHEGTKN